MNRVFAESEYNADDGFGFESEVEHVAWLRFPVTASYPDKANAKDNLDLTIPAASAPLVVNATVNKIAVSTVPAALNSTATKIEGRGNPSGARWEMTVPKMARPPRNSLPAAAASATRAEQPRAAAPGACSTTAGPPIVQKNTAGDVSLSSSSDRLQAALNLRALGRLQHALDALPAAGEFTAEFYVLRGDLQLELGQLMQAAESYSMVTERDCEHFYAQKQLGCCRHRLGEWQRAVPALEAALQLDAQRDEVRLLLADCLLRLQRVEAALACFEECRSEESRRQALFGKAVALQLLGRCQQAEKAYECLLTIHPEAGEALTNLIAMSMEAFELTRVQQYAERLLAMNPRSAEALKGIALAAIERRDYTVAALYFFQAVELDPPILQPPGLSTETTEYRISRKIYDLLVASGPKQKLTAAHAAGGAHPR